ncbi:PREDICTED: ABC transporter C family member 10-like isoform X2 [Populus euphratica]|uniref:ABC-type xenobiotic transporter n=1 Tax=Populus euphratica TaxID=75702 RepID=A0AAJ6U4C7_POPEU|nr:PREDICTED: ABC transporter C family member 10-like isoform X2 [Populus euphratica]
MDGGVIPRLQIIAARGVTESFSVHFWPSNCFRILILFLSLEAVLLYRMLSAKMVSNDSSSLGVILLFYCVFQGKSPVAERDAHINCEVLHAPLLGYEANDTSNISSDDNVTPFSKAGLFSTISFWWLNPLMKKGKKKILEDEDIPQLRPADQARTCYLLYLEQLSKWKEKGSSDPPSMWSILYFCFQKEIVISGLFALIKVLSVSAGPLLLNAFINVAERKNGFKYEGYVLTMALFLAKCLESLSERQWYFRTRLIGVQLRSMLSAAIYQKQLRLSNDAKMTHSPGEIVNYMTIYAFKLGEFPYWFHQIWTTCLELCLALVIVYYSVGLATVSALTAIILTVLVSSPLAKLQHQYQTKLQDQQDTRLKAIAEALANMKVLKLYAWEAHFRKVIEGLRMEELRTLSVVLFQRGCHMVLFWSSPILVTVVTFWSCYFLGVPLYASNVFTFLASLRIVQEPIRMIPDVATMFIEANASLDRITKFLEAPELQNKNSRETYSETEHNLSIVVRCTEISWAADSSSKAALKNIDLLVKAGEKVAICGEVGCGKSTLLAAVLGEVPRINGIVYKHGKIAYVSQTAWIQTGTIQENILFGSVMDQVRYEEVLNCCSLLKDLDMLPFGDLTEIGERGVNLSGGQKQRVQLARALYKNADIYLLDDPFSAVDAHTAASLFNEYVMRGLSGKTVLLVTHQVDFLPAFNSILLMSAGEILRAAAFDELLETCQEFQELVNAHNNTVGSERNMEHARSRKTRDSKEEIQEIYLREKSTAPSGDQLIRQEERERGDAGFKTYVQYLNHGKAFLYCFFTVLLHFLFIVGQLIQTYSLAADIQNPHVGKVELFTLYSVIGCILAFFLIFRCLSLVKLGYEASESISSKLLKSLFRAPMSFYDSTPLGRILTRVSSDLNVIDLEVAFKLIVAIGSALNAYSSLALLAVLTWPVLFLIVPLVYLTIALQKYYFSTATELMRINGTTKSLVVNHLAESIAGAMTIRAFGEEDRFFSKNLDLIDANASPYFHSFAANEWLIQRLEIPCIIVLSASALAMTLLPLGASAGGFVGMALSYGLAINVFLILSVQYQCFVAESNVSVERLEQFMHIPSEAPEAIETNRPLHNWPSVGEVEIRNLKVRYQPNAPFVLQGISCFIEGGHKIGIVGRTGSGKTTLISSLFRLVEPTEGKIIIDGLNISTIGLHDLRSHLGIIPQDPTLFSGTVRYNLDPLSEHTDIEIWEVLEKCQLREAIQQKEESLNALVAQDGSNWSMGQRQLFCLGRALLKRSKILVLDEATASIDNATDAILQKTIRTEFADCTVITVAHRIPTVMDCTKVLAISDGMQMKGFHINREDGRV